MSLELKTEIGDPLTDSEEEEDHKNEPDQEKEAATSLLQRTHKINRPVVAYKGFKQSRRRFCSYLL